MHPGKEFLATIFSVIVYCKFLSEAFPSTVLYGSLLSPAADLEQIRANIRDFVFLLAHFLIPFRNEQTTISILRHL